MYGGTLSSGKIIILKQYQTVLAAYNNQIYLFQLGTTQIREYIKLHKSCIKNMLIIKNMFYTVDADGNYSTYRIDGPSLSQWIKISSIQTKIHIDQAIIRIKQNHPEIIIRTGQQVYIWNQKSRIQVQVHNCRVILQLVDQMYAVLSEDQNHIPTNGHIMKHKNIIYSYNHSCALMSMVIFENNLICGDVNGKITILTGFMQHGQAKLYTVLEWHVHAIHTLCLAGAYLYSAGEEGVVVMWHLKENKRDFLPRIGAPITSVHIQSEYVCCMLLNDTFTLIDIAHDKNIGNYKVIVNPQCYQIVHKYKVFCKTTHNHLFMPAQPGSIQLLDLTTGKHQLIDISHRNMTSRLDNDYPDPHHVTDIAFTTNGFCCVLSGTTLKILKFYQFSHQGYQFISEIINPHHHHLQKYQKQHQNNDNNVHVLSILMDKYVSYCKNDTQIKIWQLVVKPKKSIISSNEKYWSCLYEINFRSLYPNFISIKNNQLFVSYYRNFILININTQCIEQVYSTDKCIKKVHIIQNIFILQSKTSISIYEYNNDDSIHTIIQYDQNDQVQIISKGNKIAIRNQNGCNNHIIIYNVSQNIYEQQLLLKNQNILAMFWVDQRLIIVDSTITLHDVCYNKPIICLQQKIVLQNPLMQIQPQNKIKEQDYSSLNTAYLQRKQTENKNSMNKIFHDIQNCVSINFLSNCLLQQACI